MKKIIALLLCAALMASCLYGCGNNNSADVPPSPSAEGTASPSPSDDVSPSPEGEGGFLDALDMAKGYMAFAPGTTMITSGNESFNWARCYYLINYYTEYIDSNVDSFPGWDTEIVEGLTYAQFVRNGVEDWIVTSSALKNGAAELECELDDNDLEEIEEQISSIKSQYESEEAFQTELNGMFYSEELLREDVTLSYLSNKLFKELYGENGSELTDKQVADYTASDGYMRAKHILILTTKPDENGESAPMSDEEKAEAQAQAEEILQNLKDYDGDDFDEYFTELMNEYSADGGGLSIYPDGYLFQPNEMVSEFENAWASLKDGEFSDLVETDYGYHIVYRLPIDYDTVPYAYHNYLYYGDSSQYTLRCLTAQNMFNSVLDNWSQKITLVYSQDYTDLDFTSLFVK